MKKNNKLVKYFLLSAILFAAVFSVSMAMPGIASANTNLVGTWNYTGYCTGNCSGTWLHTMNITSFDPSTGAFSGYGYYNANPNYTWNVTGTLVGSNISFKFVDKNKREIKF